MKKIIVLFLTFVSALLFNPLLAQNLPSHRHYALSCDYIPNFNPNKLTVLSPFGYKQQADCHEEYRINSYDYILSINGIPAGKFKDITEDKSATVVPAEDGRVHIKYFSMLADTVCQMSYIPCNVETVGLDELAKSGFPLIYDEENPDLIMTVAFNESMDVTSTYVPPTTKYIEKGSNTYAYTYKGQLYVNSFKNPNEKVTTGGYTHRDVETKHFLEVTFLDAKKCKIQIKRYHRLCGN